MQFSRLFGPTTLGLAVILLVYNWAEYFYEPPIWELRMFREMPFSVATVSGIAAINFGVFLLWRMPPMWRILNKYTTVAPALPFSFSVFGNTFSHSSIVHLASNMAGLALFGIPCESYSPIELLPSRQPANAHSTRTNRPRRLHRPLHHRRRSRLPRQPLDFRLHAPLPLVQPRRLRLRLRHHGRLVPLLLG